MTTKPIDETRRTFLKNTATVTAGIAVAGSAVAGNAMAGDVPRAEETVNEFKGKCALITGGARGIGLACAEELAKAGCNVVIYDIAGQLENIPYQLATDEDLGRAKSTIESYGVKCLAVKGDVRDSSKQKKTVERAVAEFGCLDFVLANAGVTQAGLLDKFTDEEVQTVLDINLGGVIKTVQAALPQMRKQKTGRILLMASVTGRMGSELFPVYSSTKWGVIGLAKSTALLMGEHNITCNALCPTLVHTKLLDNEYVLQTLFPNNPTFEQFTSVAKQFHPMKVGLYEPMRVAQAAKFFFSDDAALISGEVFDIGAGYNGRFSA